jgi:hypothetical protein
MSGPGKVKGWSQWRRDDSTDTKWAEPSILLHNFDIDSPRLKKEHTDFLHKQVAIFLSLNPGARVFLLGSASLTGTSDYDRDLSKKRQDAVFDFLVSKGVALNQIQMATPAFGKDLSGPLREDERDRGVHVSLKFPLAIEDVSLKTDDWSNGLVWDDIIGLDASSTKKRIDSINVQLTVWGAPKLWIMPDGARVPVMPDHFVVRLRSHAPKGGWGSSTILAPKWFDVPLQDPNVPSDEMRTKYRLAVPIRDAGSFLTAQLAGFRDIATAGRDGAVSNIAFRRALTWSSRGEAKLAYGSSSGVESEERPDAARLLQAVGVEVLEVEGMDKGDPSNSYGGKPPRVKTIAKHLIRSPAGVFYYSGDGKSDGCLASGGDCWASPKDLSGYWKPPFGPKVLILAGSGVLGTKNADGTPAGGVEWAKFLKSKGGPVTVILGYRDSAPAEDVAADIAQQMAAVAKGLSEDKWADAWIKINGDHQGDNTWNAVSMDANGYTWIEKRNVLERGAGPPKRIGEDHEAVRAPIN